MNLQFETLKVGIGEDKVGVITMNRPEIMNAMNTQMMTEHEGLLYAVLCRGECGGLPRRDRCRRSQLLLRGRPQGAQGHVGRDLAPAARHRRADGASHHQLPDSGHRRRKRVCLCRRHGDRPRLRFRLCGRARALCFDRGNARHHSRRHGYAEPAARGGRAPRQGDHPDGHAVHRGRRLGVGHGQQGRAWSKS